MSASFGVELLDELTALVSTAALAIVRTQASLGDPHPTAAAAALRRDQPFAPRSRYPGAAGADAGCGADRLRFGAKIRVDRGGRGGRLSTACAHVAMGHRRRSRGAGGGRRGRPR